MGFSLKNFFARLKELVDKARTEEDWEEIRTFVLNNERYAEDCGQLN